MVCSHVNGQENKSLPNIVIILVDDAGYNDFNFMGNSNLETPNIDKLASEGVIFTDAHVTSTVCAPSRAGLLTGRYQQKNGFECNSPPKGLGLDALSPTIGKIVQKKGYKTIAIGKWHVGETPELHPNNMGFDEFFGFLGGGHNYFNSNQILHNKEKVTFNEYLTDAFGDKAVVYIEKYKKEPFLMYFSPNAVHTPMQAKEIHLEKYKNHPRKQLAAMAWSLDENVGKIYNKLQQENLLENTLIFFLSDNGGAIFNQSSNSPYTSLERSVLKGWKGNEFEGGHRIPFFVNWKGQIKGGNIYKGLTSSLDIFATVEAVSNASKVTHSLTKSDGTNLIPYLLGKKEGNPHKELFWRYNETASMRYNDYKLIKLKGFGYRLYNLEADLKERKDLSKQNPQLAKKLIKKIEKWENLLSEPLWKDDDGWSAVTREIHEALLNNEHPKNNYPGEMKNHRIIEKKASLWYKFNAELGEGPVWLNDSEELLWVDINKGQVHATNTNTKQDKIIYQGDKTSCIIPVSNKEFLISDTSKIIVLNTDTKKNSEYISLKFKIPNVRFNDGKADPNGNLWVGTMEMNVLPNKGSLYLIDSEKNVNESVKDVTISNGLEWSLDKKTMYYIDTVKNGVYAFDFNEKSEISNQRMAIAIPKYLGAPDGMTIDNQGNLWVAMWGGGSVICFNPKSGQILQKIEVDAPNVTSCIFGGKNMDTLFITTARDGLLEQELDKYPDSGSVFSVQTNVSGFNPNYFIR